MRRLTGWADRRRKWLLAAALLIYLVGFNGQWRLTPDSAVYATIARNLATGHGFTHPTGGESLANPALPYLIAATFRVFGVGEMGPAVLAIWLMGLGVIGLTYSLMKLHAGRPTAVVVTCLLVISATFYRHALYVLQDMPFMLGTMVFLLGHERTMRAAGPGARRLQWQGWSLMALGMAIMAAFRIVFAIIAAALLVALAVKAVREKRWAMLAAGAVLVIVLPLAIRMLDPRASGSHLVGKEKHAAYELVQQLPQTLRHAVTVNLPDLFTNTAPKALLGNRSFWPTDVLLSILVLGSGLMLMKRRLLWGLMVLFFVVQWILFLPDVRYFLPIMPLLVYAWVRTARWVPLAVPGKAGVWLGVVAIVLFAGMNLGRTIGFIAEQRRVPFLAVYERGEYLGINEMGLAIRNTTQRNSWVFTSDKWAAALTYYSDHRVVSPAHNGDWPAKDDPIYTVLPKGDDWTTKEAVAARDWLTAHRWIPVAGFSATVPRGPGKGALELRRVEQQAESAPPRPASP